MAPTKLARFAGYLPGEMARAQLTEKALPPLALGNQTACPRPPARIGIKLDLGPGPGFGWRADIGVNRQFADSRCKRAPGNIEHRPVIGP